MRRSPAPTHTRSLAGWLALLLLATALAAAPAHAADADDLERERLAEEQHEAASGPERRIHPELLAQAATGEAVRALVVLRDEPDLAPLRGDRAAVVSALKAVADASQGEIRRLVEASGDRVLNGFWISNMLLVEVGEATLLGLGALPSVSRVVPDIEVTAPRPEDGDAGAAVVDDRTWGVDRIRAHEVWAQHGLDGTGVRVATLDTGVDIAHPDLAGKMVSDVPGDGTYPGGWIEFDADGNPVASSPYDSGNHGTHVAGTIHGGDASGVAIGVAPGADMMHGLVIPGGSGSFAQVAAGMQWAIDPFDASGAPAGEAAHVVNMSLGANGLHQEMVAPTRNMYFAGVFPAFAIGNNCGASETASPGNVYEAVAVGATDTGDDVAAFSCGGEVSSDDWPDAPGDWPADYVKPDLSAPGVDTLSAAPGGGYRTTSGTSMATPHLAGTVALMQQAAAGLDSDAVVDVLAQTAFFDDRHGSDRPNSRYGEGRIDAWEAVNLVAFDSGVTGTVVDGDTGEPLADVRVTVEGSPATARTAGDGTYELRLPPGDETLSFERFAYATATADVSVVEGEFVEVDVALDQLPTGSVAGHVTYAPSGHGVPGADVRVLGVPAPLDDETGAGGSFLIEAVPEGTYQVAASVPGLPGVDPVEVTVVADEVATADFAVPRPQRVGLIGDYGGQLAEFLDGHGIETEDHSWASLGDPAEFSTIVISYATDPGEAAFLDFLAQTDAAGTGVVFLDHAFGTHQGIRLLSRHTGSPASHGNTTASGGLPTYYEVTAEHDLLDGYEVGDRIDHDVRSSAGWAAWFDGYEGDGRQVLADLGRTDATGVRGHGIGVHERGANRHVLLSSHGVSVTRGPADWSDESLALFLRALDWVSPDLDQPEARFTVWDLDVSPGVVLGGEDVAVSVGVKNIGDLAGEFDATLRVDGAVEETTTVALGGGEHTHVAWTVSRDELGTYTVSVGPRSASFRVRAPVVTVEAAQLDGGGPLAGASVELVRDGGVEPVATTGEDGRATFESPEAIASYTLVVRRGPSTGDGASYLLTRPLHVDEDVTVDLAPASTSHVVAGIDLDAVGASHDATVYVAHEDTGRWAFGLPPGPAVLTTGAYAARHVHTVAGPASVWWLPTDELALDLSQAGPATLALGGAAELSLGDVRDQDAPDLEVTWDLTDAHGHAFATVLEGSPQPFAQALGAVVHLDEVVGELRSVAELEHEPVLRLAGPDGADLRSGVIGWTRPFAFDYPTEEVLPGRHTLELRADTGPYADRLDATAWLVVPARTLPAGAVAPGGTFEVSVTFDAPEATDGSVTLSEELPDGFEVVAWSASPRVHRLDFEDGTWTWSERGRSGYWRSEMLEVVYEVRVGDDVEPGAYALEGEATHHGSGLVRAVAGPGTVIIE